MSRERDPAAGARGAESADYSIGILRPLVTYVEDTYGREVLEEAVVRAGWELAELREGGVGWFTFDRFEALHRALRAVVKSDDEHRRASAYRFKESFGPFVFLVRTLSPRTFYQRLPEHARSYSRVCDFQCLEASDTRAVLRYRSPRNEGRLNCVARQGQMMAVPEVFGSPPARLEERSCVARGDPCCEYVLTWQEHFRVLTPALGLVLGGAASVAALVLFRHPLLPLLPVVPVLGLSLGWISELRRLRRLRRRVSEEMGASVHALAAQAADAREEVLALTERQAAWVTALERQADERTEALHAVAEQVRRIREQQAVDLRGFSHDLRNPLAVVRMHQRILREHASEWGLGQADLALLGQMERTLGQIDGLLEGLLRDAMRDVSRSRPVLEALEVTPLVEKLRRRLAALVLGRPIRVDVSAKREAPAAVRTDPLLFEGVVDALLAKAARHTERGAIQVEIDGSPGDLCLRVADTGAGLAATRIEEVFEGESSRSKELGLSCAVRLLGQLGGRLEVISQPGVGTTFCARLPVGKLGSR